MDIYIEGWMNGWMNTRAARGDVDRFIFEWEMRRSCAAEGGIARQNATKMGSDRQAKTKLVLPLTNVDWIARRVARTFLLKVGFGVKYKSFWCSMCLRTSEILDAPSTDRGVDRCAA